MPGGPVVLAMPGDINRIEAPVTFKAYLMCAFAAFAGIFFGFDTGYINETMAMPYFIHQFAGLPYPAAGATTAESAYFAIPAWRQFLIVSILSAGTFTGAVIAGDCPTPAVGSIASLVLSSTLPQIFVAPCSVSQLKCSSNLLVSISFSTLELHSSTTLGRSRILF